MKIEDVCVEVGNQMNYKAYLDAKPLAEALWWFVEERDGLDQDQASEIFFRLRQRFRTEYQRLAATPKVSA